MAYTDVYSLAATLYQLLSGEKPPSVRDRSLARAKLKPPQEVNPQSTRSHESGDSPRDGVSPGRTSPNNAGMVGFIGGCASNSPTLA
ncbi:hypothetical protein [Coleofasciculus sp. G2-EDA-02]|uniref:hypothetical protein n=1 Tax=Coleofasciculus sp. G2-EDA-02 TaxID=3069529 RepID=UPI0032F1ECD7